MLRDILVKILSLPKTIIVNFKCLGIREALKLPIRCHYKTDVSNLRKGCIQFENKFGSLSIGFGNGTAEIGRNNKCVIMFKGGRIIIKDNAQLSAGTTFIVGGDIILGSNFSANANFMCTCESKVQFGDDMAIGWNVQLSDSDGHEIWDGETIIKRSKPIICGNHSWICSEATIMKGAILPEGSILAYRAVLTKAYREQNSLYAGIPAKRIKGNINWKK